jgi:Ser/Thr protein kinase RdoA (MazF antagonist)
MLLRRLSLLFLRLRRLGTAPRTLLHGDLRLDNVLWRPPPAPPAAVQQGSIASTSDDAAVAALPSARYIDMGDCAAGRGPFDIAYFMSMSLDTQARSAAWHACACVPVRVRGCSHALT